MAKRSPPEPDWAAQRRAMVEQQIRSRGLHDRRLLAALMAVPREQFVPADVRAAAYEDRPLPIGSGQTISQPYIVAYMTAQLAPVPDSRILEIGTGSGYQTAILAHLGAVVYTVERRAELSERAGRQLAALGLPAKVHLYVGDGSIGLEEVAPLDRIIVTAAAPRVPPALVDQLAEGGVLVAPVGGERVQTIVRVTREGHKTIETPLLACRFVRLIGQGGWGRDVSPD